MTNEAAAPEIVQAAAELVELLDDELMQGEFGNYTISGSYETRKVLNAIEKLRVALKKAKGE